MKLKDLKVYHRKRYAPSFENYDYDESELQADPEYDEEEIEPIVEESEEDKNFRDYFGHVKMIFIIVLFLKLDRTGSIYF